MKLTQEYREKFVQLTEENNQLQLKHSKALKQMEMGIDEQVQKHISKFEEVNKKQS